VDIDATVDNDATVDIDIDVAGCYCC